MRLEGWEERLAAVIESARHERYELGVHDCFRVATQAVAALTGVDHWPQWAGTYSTPRQALVHIAKYGGDFDGAASKLFGTEPVSPRMARRGDILKFLHNGEPHLGVCNGRSVAVLGPEGLRHVELLACEKAWRVG